jgi:hypothetical protein
MQEINEELIERVMDKYKDVLSNQFSPEYNFFNFIKNIKEFKYYYLFSEFLNGLDKDDFSIQDILEFLKENDFPLLESRLEIFLKYVEENKKKIKINRIKTLIFNNTYGQYGNIFSELNIIYTEIESNLFYKFNEEDDPVFLDTKNFLLLPKINYYTNKEGFYPDAGDAEEDYWDIISEWKQENTPLPTFEINLSRDLFGYLTNRNYGGLSLGIPLLLNKTFQKSRYMYEQTIDDFMTKILKESYILLSIEEVFDSLDLMVADMVEYIDANHIDFDYNNSDIDEILLPFYDYKLDQLKSTPISAINLSINREIKFFIFFLSKYFKTPSDNEDLLELEDLNERINLEFNELRTVLVGVREKLLEDGYFEEYLK